MKRTILGLFVFFVIFLAGCAQPNSDSSKTVDSTNQKLIIATTFYPLLELTRNIAGNNVEVFSMVPIHSEPHSFQATPQDIIKLNNAKILVTMGIEFEEFEEDLIEATGGDKWVIAAGVNILLLDVEEGEEHEDEHVEEEDHVDEEQEEESEEHGHTGKDPHVWLSPKNAMQMAQNINQGLSQADPTHASIYEQNTQQLTQQLAIIDQRYRSELSNCKKDTILVAHNAYSYLANDYGFTTIEISGISPESEPTPQQIKRLIDEAEEHDLKYIFYEETIDPKISKTIADQVGAQTLVLNSLETASSSDGTYLGGLQENLNNLKLVLECR